MAKGKNKENKGGDAESSLALARTVLLSPAAAIALIALTALVVYSATFTAPFVLDEAYFITDNPKVHDLHNFTDVSGTRYLAFLSFALNYAAGGDDPFGYHVVNTAIHAANGILLYTLLTLIFMTPSMNKDGDMTVGSAGLSSSQAARLIPLVAALIFVAHPVQTQAVTYITQRFASLATFFYLLTMVLYTAARDLDVTTTKAKIIRTPLYVLSFISVLAAMKTKEMTFTLPFMIILIEFTFFPREKLKKHFTALAPFILTLVLIPVSIFLPATGVDEEMRFQQVEDMDRLSQSGYVFTQFRVIMTYLRLLVLPIGQNIDHDYPRYTSFLDGPVLFSFLPLIFIIFYSALRYKGSRDGGGLPILGAFAALWFFISLMVESSFIPLRDVIAEHRLYLPMAAAATAFTVYVFNSMSKRGVKDLVKATCILLALTVLPLGAAAYKRNLVWRDKIVLWEDAARKSPGKSRVLIGLGIAYDEAGRMEDAMGAFRRAIGVDWSYAEGHYNLARIYEKAGKINEAVEEYQLALKLHPPHQEARLQLANVYYKVGRTGDAILEFNEALTFDPFSVDAHFNLGNLYLDRGYMEGAIREYSETITLAPELAPAHYNLALAYLRSSKLDRATIEFKETLRLNPAKAEAHYNLGAIYSGKGLNARAAWEFRSALELRPGYDQARVALALSYMNRGLNKEALAAAKEWLSTEPGNKRAVELVEAIELEIKKNVVKEPAVDSEPGGPEPAEAKPADAEPEG